MFLYFNGDSFVDGSELGDDIIPDYPGLSDKLQSDRSPDCPITKWQKTAYLTERPYDFNVQIRVLEKQRAFPAKVANILNLPFINNAQSDASSDRIARTSLNDLIELKKTHDKIIACIGTTLLGRYEAPAISPEYDWYNYALGFVNPKTPSDAALLRDYRIRNEQDYHSLINFYKNAIIIQDFCKLHDIKLLWMGSLVTDRKRMIKRGTKILSKKQDFVSFQEYCDLDYALDIHQCYFDNFLGQKVICPGGHFSEAVQDFLAKELSEKIKEFL